MQFNFGGIRSKTKRITGPRVTRENNKILSYASIQILRRNLRRLPVYMHKMRRTQISALHLRSLECIATLGEISRDIYRKLLCRCPQFRRRIPEGKTSPAFSDSANDDYGEAEICERVAAQRVHFLPGIFISHVNMLY